MEANQAEYGEWGSLTRDIIQPQISLIWHRLTRIKRQIKMNTEPRMNLGWSLRFRSGQASRNQKNGTTEITESHGRKAKTTKDGTANER